MEIEQAYAKCHTVIKNHSKTFAKAFSYLPRDRKRAVWAVYGFCRHVDDVVDEGENPVRELAEVKEELIRFERREEVPQRHFWIALDDVRRKFDLDLAPFHDMIRGQETDLEDVEMITMDELLTYSYNVASTVGLMLLPILAPGKYKVLKQDAIYLGYAMQLTNILRDVGEDLERGRIYIPREHYEAFGYTKEELISKTKSAEFIMVWESLAKKAESYYEKAMTSLNEYPVTSRLPVKGAALLYMNILEAVRQENYNVFNKRIYISDEQKKKIIARLQ